MQLDRCAVEVSQLRSSVCRLKSETGRSSLSTAATSPVQRGNLVVHRPNVLAASTTYGTWVRAPPPLARGIPMAIWNTQGIVNWDAAESVGLAPLILPGLPPWPGQQLLSGRERRWIAQPVLRSISFTGWNAWAQLEIHAQLREDILIP
ncbi:uncharacterized protein BP01DRAFT_386747 [Aspergillus saccharolyticus JOP 1030-1]|uniref:Uncharacterized protein n=1 Tax=Aspergillus saccharolyticus JOP 1030-1 TaxID=1450539 RepID=A0A318Z408_9EURO|nr:hypothetical protein BP01DRAFT_386747 [Aspergillus saccharolyticus JOP 1030-1]PYH41057.1 hypothetical protein BP01DRAFT_386747 [Aspergillus saccharolyticus JOP 1030-1]